VIKINVIDLDHTLIPYDSFGRLIKNGLRQFDFHVVFYTSLRILRIISSSKFKQIVTFHWQRVYDKHFFYKYGQAIVNDINKSVLNIIKTKTDSNTINILISASPDLYIKNVINHLKWVGSGSYFDGENYINLYSYNKIEWLKKNYPDSHYKYNFAISDSYTDLELMMMFNEFILWEKN